MKQRHEQGKVKMTVEMYVPNGPTGIYVLQEFCGRVGIKATNEGIRDLIGAIRVLPT
jgi:hypothetical protein